jgi:hypothetical protein
MKLLLPVAFLDVCYIHRTPGHNVSSEELHISLCKCHMETTAEVTSLGYGLDDRGSRVRFLAEAGNFSFHHRIQTGSGAHPDSYPVGTRGSLTGGKAAGT